MRHKPTNANRRQIDALVACGIPVEDIADTLGTDLETLRKYYSHQLDTGAKRINRKVALLLLKAALAGDVRAMGLWLTCRAGWSSRLLEPLRDRRRRLIAEAQDANIIAGLGKKAAAVVVAKQTDAGAALGGVLARRGKRKDAMGFELPGLGGAANKRPVTNPDAAA